MNNLSQQLVHDIETLPLAMQEEVHHFVEFLKLKAKQPAEAAANDNKEPNGTKLAHLMEEVAERGTAFREIEDPAAWQREIRKDRPLPGRG